MLVHFVSKKNNTTVIPCPEIGDRHVIRFANSKYSTSNKQEIFKLLNSAYGQKYIELTPGQDEEAINEYISSSDKQATMDRKFLDSIPKEAWREILAIKGKELGVQFPMIEIAKVKLLGKELDDTIESICRKHSATARPLTGELQRKSKETQELNTEVEELEVPEETTSVDFNATEAASIIRDTELSELEGFVTEEEERVTVLRAWEDKLEEAGLLGEETEEVEEPTE